MPKQTCPECQGPLRLRASGFSACRNCGKLVVTGPMPKQPEAPAHDHGDSGLVPDFPPIDLTKPKPASSVGKDTPEVELPHVIVPDYSECMEGWRAWGVSPDLKPGAMPLLHSVTYNATAWMPREVMEAECNKNQDHVPGERCRCGLYAAKTFEHLQSMTYHEYDAERLSLYHVVGEVALWGKVIEGTQGWRAQYGYPRKLFVPFEAYRLVKPLAEAYGCPVFLKNILKDVAEGGDE